MELRFTAEEEAFREEVRAFLADALPKALAEKVRLGRRVSKQETEAWQATLSAKGAHSTDRGRRFHAMVGAGST
jgi:hypothetical protein